MHTPDALKKKLFEKVVHDVNRTNHQRSYKGPQLEDLTKLFLAFQGTRFFETTRGMQVAERLMEIHPTTPEPVFREIMKRVFRFFNFRESTYARLTGREFHLLDSNSQKDIDKYFTTELPVRIGINYGALHAKGLLHGHPHLNNISLVGSIYDTDSVKGKPLGLGDPEVTEEEKLKEVEYLLYGTDEFEQPLAMGVTRLLTLMENHKRLTSREFIAQRFETMFYFAYFLERGWGDKLLENLDKIYPYMELKDRPKFTLVEERLLGIIAQDSGWEYKFNDSADQIINKTFQADPDFWENSIDKIVLEGDLSNTFEEVLNNNLNTIIKQDIEKKVGENMQQVTESYGEKISECLTKLMIRWARINVNVRLQDQFRKINGKNAMQKKKNLEKYLIKQYEQFLDNKRNENS